MAIQAGISYGDWLGLTPWQTFQIAKASADMMQSHADLAMLIGYNTAQLTHVDPKKFPKFDKVWKRRGSEEHDATPKYGSDEWIAMRRSQIQLLKDQGRVKHG